MRGPEGSWSGIPLVELVAALPDATRGALDHVGFVCLRPDALMDDRAGALVEHLDAEVGLRTVELRPMWVSGAVFDAIYRRKMAFVGRAASLHHELFSSGPAAFALVVGSPGEAPSVGQLLDGLKGSSMASGEEDPATIRARFGRQSSLHAVLHNAEDTPSLVEEASLVFGWDVLVDHARSLASGRPAPTIDPRRRRVLLRPHRAAASVFEVAVDLKQRIAVTLATHRDLPDEDVEVLDRLDAHYDQALPVLAAATSFGEQRRVYDDVVAVDAPALDDLLGRVGDPSARLFADAVAGVGAGVGAQWRRMDRAADAVRLVQVSRLLGGVETCGPELEAALFDVLDRSGVPVPRWTRTIVLAGLRVDLVR